MGRRYGYLTMEDREEVSRGLAKRLSLRAIGRRIGRPASTISRELNRAGRNQRTYRAFLAQIDAKQRAKRVKKPRKLTQHDPLWETVAHYLRRQWSPEQIAHRLPDEYPQDMTMRISHEAIYAYLYVLPRGALKKELLGYLRHRHRTRRKRGLTHQKRGQIPNMISIEERPIEVADRIVPGHWEGDLIQGKDHQSALGTLVERTTRTTILVPLTAQNAPSVRRAFARAIKNLPQEMKLSLTYDRGKEMTEHERFTKQTKVQVYFAHPYSPWERGTNENTNGLIRQYFPKGTDFRTVNRRHIKEVQDLLNGRPRKVLLWKTPYEVIGELLH